MPGFQVSEIGGNRNFASPTKEFYYTYTWEIRKLFGNDVAVQSDNALIYAKDVTLPSFNVSKELVNGSSLEYKFAKGVNFDDVKVSWYDSVGLLETIRQWRQSIWTNSGGIGIASEYKKESIITQFLPNSNDDDENIQVNFVLYGSWPSIIRYGDLTYSNSDVKIVEVTITYDWFSDDNLNT